MPTDYWQGKLIRLRAVEPSDWQAHHEWNRDSEMSRRLDHVWFPQSEASARRWAEQASTNGAQGDGFHFEIETLTGELVGSISTHNCDSRNGTFEYGIAIRSEHKRRGYASEAILLLLRYYFQELRYQKVTVSVYSFNEESIGLHTRLGFQQEG